MPYQVIKVMPDDTTLLLRSLITSTFDGSFIKKIAAAPANGPT